MTRYVAHALFALVGIVWAPPVVADAQEHVVPFHELAVVPPTSAAGHDRVRILRGEFRGHLATCKTFAQDEVFVQTQQLQELVLPVVDCARVA